MNYEVRFTAAYRRDHKAIRNWYEEQREGLGDEFELSVEQALDRVCRMPLGAPEVYPKTRIVTLSRFPYNFFYRVEGHYVVAIGIFHKRRDPKAWQKRFGANGHD